MREQDLLWSKLEKSGQRFIKSSILEEFQKDPERHDNFSFRLDNLFVDLSKNLIDTKVLKDLQQLAAVQKVDKLKEGLFSGAILNNTENRPALHVALRAPSSSVITVEGTNIVPKVERLLEEMMSFANSIRSGAKKGLTKRRFTNILHIGSGGSLAGPMMVLRALSSYQQPNIQIDFVGNADSSDLQSKLRKLDPETTLVVVASKTFATQETILNAETTKKWMLERLGPSSLSQHFVAITGNKNRAKSFGVIAQNIFEEWEWVGGRFSLWSAVGLTIILGIGTENFKQFLQGARTIDEHFLNTAPENNLPLVLGMLEIWYTSVLKFGSRAIIPYDHRLEGFVSYIQQLEMESNGKSVDKDGQKMTQKTAAVVWGSEGTNAQHSFFQLLHQGTSVIPCDFLIAAVSDEEFAGHQEVLLANCLAQARALMTGRSLQKTTKRLIDLGLSSQNASRLAPHSTFIGNRPSTIFLFKQLTPNILGQLIAIYEHKTFVQGALWNINSFDQWGVELGKELTNEILPLLKNKIIDPKLDRSTANLIEEVFKFRK